MSFLSDLFEGKWSNLGTDITHAPASLVRDYRSEWPYAAAAAALAIPFVGPDIAAGVAGLTGLDAFAGGTAAADAGLTAADVAAGGAAAGDVLSSTLPADALALAPDAAAAATDPFAAWAGLDLSGGTGLSAAASDTAAAAPTFAQTDAELTGGITGTGGAAPAAAGGGGGGLTDTLSGIIKSPWTKLAVGAAPLALTLARGEPSLPPQIAAAQANAQQLAQQGGNLNASQNSVLQQMKQDATNAARQAMFNQGVQNPEADSRWPQWVAQIDSQVSAAAQQMIQQNIQNSLQGDAQLIQIAQLQMSSDQAFTNNLIRATTAMGTSFGLGGGGFRVVPQ